MRVDYAKLVLLGAFLMGMTLLVYYTWQQYRRKE